MQQIWQNLTFKEGNEKNKTKNYKQKSKQINQNMQF